VINTNRSRTLSLLAAALVLMTAGCSDVEIRPGLPTHINKLAIPVFMNRSSQPNVENELTQQLTNDFLMDNRIQLAPVEQADAILQGTIVQYQLEPMLLDVHNTPQQYKLRMVLSLVLKDTAAGNPIWTEEGYTDSTTYYVANTLNIPAENENLGRKRLIQQLSKRIVLRVVEGF
jgi:hypothetical protein